MLLYSCIKKLIEYTSLCNIFILGVVLFSVDQFKVLMYIVMLCLCILCDAVIDVCLICYLFVPICVHVNEWVCTTDF